MKKNSSDKFFYSEIEDKIIVDFVSNDFKQKQLERRRYELIWELNLNFYLGNQYSYISDGGDIQDIQKTFWWENREVYNHIAPIIETRIAKLNKIKSDISIKPNSGSDNDVYSARIAKSVVDSAFENNYIDTLIKTATYWSEITGTSFYKVNWDSELGDIIGKSNEKLIKNGDVKISVCSPFEIYPDSNDTQNLDDCASIAQARVFPVAYINELYNLKLTGEDIDLFELNNHSCMSNISGRSNFTKIAHSKKHDHVLVIERYEKPSPKFPNGKLTIICKDKLLYDGDLPYNVGKNNKKGYPFIKQVSTPQIASFWGTSVIERCIPIQRAYNSIKNKKHEFIARLASGVLSVEDGSVDVDNLEDEGLAPGKILIYRSGSKAPEFLNPGSIPSDFDDEEEKLLRELNKLACISEVATNTSLPGGINSGTAISMLIGQDDLRMSLTGENIRIAIKQIAQYVLRLYKQFATQVRLNKLSDDNGKLELFYWNNNDIASDDVIIDTENELSDTLSEKKEILISLLNKGILENNDGIISTNTKSKILDILGFSDLLGGDDISGMHRAKANKENLKIIDLRDPLEIDNDLIHIEEHTKYLISDKINDDKEFIEKLIRHIKIHKDRLSKEK